MAGRTIATTIALNGEQKFKQSVKSLESDLKAMKAELESLSSEYNENAESVENLAKRQELMQNIVRSNEEKFNAMRGAVNDSAESYRKATEELERLKEEFGENSRQVRRQAEIVATAEARLDRYRTELARAENQLNRSRAELQSFNEEFMNTDADESTSALQRFRNTLEQADNRIAEFREKMTKVMAVVGETATKLKNATTSVAKFSAKTAEITFKPATASLEMFGKMSTKTIAAASKAVIGYTTALTGMGAALMTTVEDTKEYRADLAKLETASLDAGNSFDVMKDQMLEISALTGEADASIEALNNLMATGLSDSQVTKAVEALSGAVVKFPDTLKIESLADGLQETIATGAGAGTFAELVERMGYSLDDFNEGLANCTTQAERQNYAMEFLADTGLAKINEEYRNANASALDYEKQQLRLTDATAKLGEAFEPTKAALTAYGADFLNIFTDMLAGTDTGTEQLKDKINSFVDDLSKSANTYLPKFADFTTNIVTVVGESLSENLPKIIDEVFPTLIKSTEQLALSIVDTLPTFAPKIVESGVKMLSGLINSVNTVLDRLLPIIPGIITDIGAVLVENAPQILDSAVEMFGKLIEALSLSVTTIAEQLPSFIDTLVNSLISEDNLSKILQSGLDLFLSIGQGITNSIPTILEAIPQVIDDMVTTLTNKDNISDFINTGIDLIKALAEGLPKAVVSISSGVGEVTTQIIDEIKKVDWWGVGQDIVEGILSGFLDIDFKMDEYLGEFGDNWLTGMKDIFDIHSPSRLMRDEVGKYLGLGVVEGFENSLKDAMPKMKIDVPEMVTGDLTKSISAYDAVSQSTGNVTSYSNSYTTPIYVTIQNANMTSTADIDALAEGIARQSRIQSTAVGKRW